MAYWLSLANQVGDPRSPKNTYFVTYSACNHFTRGTYDWMSDHRTSNQQLPRREGHLVSAYAEAIWGLYYDGEASDG